MNKRIIELLHEANFLKFTVSDAAAISKFVELLIKEAAKVADANYDAGFCPVGQDIKEHFGID